VTAILGSCLAVGLWDFSAGVGGLCHFLLPQWNGAGSATSPRFGNFAVAELVKEVCAAGANRPRLFAKIFGGASVLEKESEVGHLKIGRRNVDLARQILTEASIPILAEDVGGNRGRKLTFQTHDGNAWVKFLDGEGR
jgi:chemotaxis protein CheD